MRVCVCVCVCDVSIELRDAVESCLVFAQAHCHQFAAAIYFTARINDLFSVHMNSTHLDHVSESCQETPFMQTQEEKTF